MQRKLKNYKVTENSRKPNKHKYRYIISYVGRCTYVTYDNVEFLTNRWVTQQKIITAIAWVYKITGKKTEMGGQPTYCTNNRLLIQQVVYSFEPEPLDGAGSTRGHTIRPPEFA